MMHSNRNHPTDIQKGFSPSSGEPPSSSDCAGSVLQHLGIPCQPYPCRNGEFYFCTVPTDKRITFNLRVSPSRTIRLWRFIGTVPLSAAGHRWEYRKPGGPRALIGLEVTAEGDVCLFAEQDLEPQGAQNRARIARMLVGYIHLIASLSDKLSPA